VPVTFTLALTKFGVQPAAAYHVFTCGASVWLTQ
jgi:hypothetical protein